MKQEEGKRRSFLKHILAGSAVVAGIAVTSKKTEAKNAVEQDTTLYRESEDFKKYYQSIRS